MILSFKYTLLFLMLFVLLPFKSRLSQQGESEEIVEPKNLACFQDSDCVLRVNNYAKLRACHV